VESHSQAFGISASKYDAGFFPHIEPASFRLEHLRIALSMRYYRDSIIAIIHYRMESIVIVNMLPDLLKQNDISIRELSRLTGVTYTTIRAAYHGERSSIKLDVLDAICRTLDLQPGDIYRFVAPGQTPPKAGASPPSRKIVPQKLVEPAKPSKTPPGGSDAWVTWE
jgi:putative transcriptional regulator